jgi:hypothetical protein
MGMHSGRRRTLALVVALFAVIVIGGVVSAYWTGGGAGTGSATAGTAVDLTVNQTTSLTPMYPGDSAQVISGTFDNSNAGPTYVTTVTVSISSVTKAGGAPAGTCDATDFTLAGATATVNASVPVGTSQGAWTGPSLKFNNKVSNQDACKGATVHLAYSIP